MLPSPKLSTLIKTSKIATLKDSMNDRKRNGLQVNQRKNAHLPPKVKNDAPMDLKKRFLRQKRKVQALRVIRKKL